MMNINILNKVVKGVAEQIPLVNSFYTQSPYESWNVNECKYGSISFVVTKTTNRENTTTYDAVLYYGDRLTEDKSNIDSIHSDAATVIQTIVGALNQTNEEYIDIEYPVGITLFEQKFCDELAGGYANLIINVEGMGECFEDAYDIPEIVGTSAYYTKDEIIELFPLKTSLSTVAYSGSFRDLRDIPNLTTEVQYNQLMQRVLNLTEMTHDLENNKVDNTTFNDVIKSLGGDLSGVATKQQLDTFINGQNQINTNLAVELKNKVSSGYFQEEITKLNNEIASKVNQRSFDAHITDNNNKFTELEQAIDKKVSNDTLNGVNQVITNLAVEVGTKLDKDYFDGWKDNVISTLSTKVSTQTFTNTVSNMYTKSEVDNLVANSGGSVDVEQVEQIVNDVVGEAIDNITEDVIESVRVELDELVNEEIQSQIGEFVTEAELETAVAEQYNKIINTDEFKEELSGVVESAVTEFVGDIVTEAELASKNLASKYYVDNRFDAATTNINTAIEEVNGQFDSYYNKSEVDTKIKNVKVDLSDYPTKTEVSDTYLTKSDAVNTYITKDYTYTKSEIDAIGSAINNRFPSYLSKTEAAISYYNKSQIDTKLDNVKVDLSAYYTKDQVNTLIDSVEVDMTDYYTKEDADLTFCSKSDTYTKAQIDSKDKIINNKFGSYYTKTEVDELVNSGDLSNYYTKDEVNDIVDNIQVGGSGEIELTNYYTKSESDNKFSKKTDVYTKSEVYPKGEVYNKTEITNNFYSKSQIDDIVDNIDVEDVDLSAYYTKVEVDNKIANVKPDLTDYYTKEEVNDIVDNIVVGEDVDLTNYYTKTEVDNKIKNVTVDLTGYYTKEEVNDIISGIEVGGDVDLSNYYKKTETYNRTEIDNKISNVEVDLSSYYTKTEVNAIVGDIDSILNNVLYSK